MSGEKALTLTERESYLLSRLGDAWVELNRKHYDVAVAELAEAQVAADDVTEAAARARDDAADLRTAVREWSKANRACSQWVSGTGTDDESPLRRLSRAERELHALAATEGRADQ